MNRRSVGVLSLVLIIALAFVGCDLISVVGVSKGNLRIQGVVVDEDGVGLGGVAVLIDTDVIGVTVSNGTWNHANVKKGAKVTVKKQGWVFDPEPALVKEDNQTIHFVGTRNASTEYAVGGRVVSAGGLAIEGVVVSFADEQGTVQTAFSDSNGFFSKSGMVGRIAVTAFLEGWEFTPVSRTVNGEDSNLSFYGTPSVEYTYEASGLILMSDGAPVPSVLLQLEFLDLDREDLFTITTPEGTWNMDGLLGRVRITPTKDGFTFHPRTQTIDKAMMYVSFTAH
jgi:hypothetical protein